MTSSDDNADLFLKQLYMLHIMPENCIWMDENLNVKWIEEDFCFFKIYETHRCCYLNLYFIKMKYFINVDMLRRYF